MSERDYDQEISQHEHECRQSILNFQGEMQDKLDGLIQKLQQSLTTATQRARQQLQQYEFARRNHEAVMSQYNQVSEKFKNIQQEIFLLLPSDSRTGRGGKRKAERQQSGNGSSSSSSATSAYFHNEAADGDRPAPACPSARPNAASKQQRLDLHEEGSFAVCAMEEASPDQDSPDFMSDPNIPETQPLHQKIQSLEPDLTSFASRESPSESHEGEDGGAALEGQETSGEAGGGDTGVRGGEWSAAAPSERAERAQQAEHNPALSSSSSSAHSSDGLLPPLVPQTPEVRAALGKKSGGATCVVECGVLPGASSYVSWGSGDGQNSCNAMPGGNSGGELAAAAAGSGGGVMPTRRGRPPGSKSTKRL